MFQTLSRCIKMTHCPTHFIFVPHLFSWDLVTLDRLRPKITIIFYSFSSSTHFSKYGFLWLQKYKMATSCKPNSLTQKWPFRKKNKPQNKRPFVKTGDIGGWPLSWITRVVPWKRPYLWSDHDIFDVLPLMKWCTLWWNLFLNKTSIFPPFQIWFVSTPPTLKNLPFLWFQSHRGSPDSRIFSF